MDVLWHPQNESLIFHIPTSEARGLAIILQMAWNEQKKKKGEAPAFSDDFFENLISRPRPITLEFKLGYLDFMSAFVETIIKHQKRERKSTNGMEKILGIITLLKTKDLTVQ